MSQEQIISKRKYFHTFDALRFFSFFIVFLHHTPISKNSFFDIFGHSGGIGVSFFFVLSGFLITYILLFEKLKYSKISLKRFYMRRILRIWPLFYAMVLFAFATPFILQLLNLPYSSEGYKPELWTSLLFLENYKMMITGTFPDGAPLRVMWSLCVEEHFYIIWGIIFYFFQVKDIPLLIFISIVFSFFIKILYHFWDIPTADVLSNLDYFAFGAIPAYILLQKNIIIDKVANFKVGYKYLILFFTLAFIFISPTISWNWWQFFDSIAFGILFSLIILFILPDKNYLYISNDNIFSKLGIYTYSLYLFHTIFISFLLQINKIISFELNNFMIAVIALLLTISASFVSYHVFEKQFLKLKKYFY